MTKKVLLFTLFLLLMVSTLFLFCGCIDRQPHYDFMAYESGDVYTCQIDEQTSFWYSPEYVYGEWCKGDTVIPMKLSFKVASSAGNAPLKWIQLHFFNEYGSPFAQVRLHKDSTNAERSIIDRMYDFEVLDPQYQTFVEEQLNGVNFEGIEIKKLKKDVAYHESLYAPLLNFFSEEATYILEGANMWFVGTPITEEYYTNKGFYSEGYGFRKVQTEKPELAYFHIMAFRDPSGDIMGEQESTWVYLDYYRFTQHEYRIVNSFVLFIDEQGVFVRVELNGEEQKVYIKKATPETDPQREFWAFLAPEDENGNEYVFSCADGNFSYAGNTGEGIWESETQQKQIYVDKNTYPLQLIIKEAGDKEETLVIATFVEMVDEHTAKFEIDKEYLSNPIFGDALTEFYITKQIIEQ